jgi:hypothetical protein
LEELFSPKFAAKQQSGSHSQSVIITCFSHAKDFVLNGTTKNTEKHNAETL